MDLHNVHYAACRSACLPSTVNIHLDAAAWPLSSQSQFSLHSHFPLEWQVVPLYETHLHRAPQGPWVAPLRRSSFEALAGERPTFWTSRQMHSTNPCSLSFEVFHWASPLHAYWCSFGACGSQQTEQMCFSYLSKLQLHVSSLFNGPILMNSVCSRQAAGFKKALSVLLPSGTQHTPFLQLRHPWRTAYLGSREEETQIRLSGLGLERWFSG